MFEPRRSPSRAPASLWASATWAGFASIDFGGGLTPRCLRTIMTDGVIEFRPDWLEPPKAQAGPATGKGAA